MVKKEMRTKERGCQGLRAVRRKPEGRQPGPIRGLQGVHPWQAATLQAELPSPEGFVSTIDRRVQAAQEA
jgi:hypothetical protein